MRTLKNFLTEGRQVTLSTIGGDFDGDVVLSFNSSAEANIWIEASDKYSEEEWDTYDVGDDVDEVVPSSVMKNIEKALKAKDSKTVVKLLDDAFEEYSYDT